MVISSDDDDLPHPSPTGMTPDMPDATRDEIPDIWEGFDEGCADAFAYEQNPVASQQVVSKRCVYIAVITKARFLL